jgi:hypothetical protein
MIRLPVVAHQLISLLEIQFPREPHRFSSVLQCYEHECPRNSWRLRKARSTLATAETSRRWVWVRTLPVETVQGKSF